MGICTPGILATEKLWVQDKGIARLPNRGWAVSSIAKKSSFRSFPPPFPWASDRREEEQGH